MRWLLPGGRSIRQKLITIVLATTFLALAIAGAILVVFDLKSYQEALESDLATQADIVGTASVAALAFNDTKAARENLGLLRASSAVSAAAVYRDDGSLFATFVRDDGGHFQFPSKPETTSARFQDNGLALFRPITSEGEPIGSVYLLGRDESMQRLQHYLGVLGVVMAISLLTALLLTNRLQASLTRPVTAISDVARRVMEQRDFSLRAARTTDDEIGLLVDAFNDMLTELGRRAEVLEASIRALHESDERYQLAVRGSSAGLWDWNIGADQVFLSPSFKELVDYDEPASGKGMDAVLELLHSDDRGPTRQAIDDHLSGRRPYRTELRMRARSGEHRWFYMSGEAVAGETGTPYRMAGSIIDIHGRKAAEAALQEANRLKDEFIATLAHELRNPLAPIRTGLQILAAAPAGSDSAVKAREIIERQLIHMVRLVDDLLDISRITSAKVKLDKAYITVQQAVEASIEASAPFIEASGQQLSVSMPQAPIAIFADLTRMAQAIGNILNNAAKYTPRGGRISLEASRDGEEAVIRIADNGAGIPGDMLDRVFDMFTQVSATMGDAQGGLGIGLSIVRRLIDLHDGTVQASSAGPGRGSEFTIRLPCARPEPRPVAEAPPVVASDVPLASLRVLVVDDNIDAARTMVMLLEMSGHRAWMVHNGPDALAAAIAEPPDAVLLDIGLPGMSGYEVARSMRTERVLDRTALIALTGWGSEADKLKATGAGFDAHLTKPVGPDVVLDLLARLRPADAGPVGT